MSFVDYLIFCIYFVVILSVGIYFYVKNKSRDDYYVGNRSISAKHVGLSIVATDVGGGFSIGLGGLGFVMGISGSWLLFTGLVGAWLTAIFIIPKVKLVDAEQGMLTYPDFLRFKYGKNVALAAAIISGIGYMGFTGAQILAGAKLAAGSLFSEMTMFDPMDFSLFIMASIVLLYTVLGGIKAVIYTDTIQWIVLLAGLIFFGIPFSYVAVGGWEVISQQLPSEYFSLTNISAIQLINWFFTIIPIWFIAMTLYQRIYACKNEKEAKKAFFIAGIFEYPIMAFMGVLLGMMARVMFPEAEPEMGMPMLLRNVLPAGVAGIVVAAYFSAIMSTADSCLIASSGNIVNDIIEKYFIKRADHKFIMRLSQAVTMIIGVVTVLIAGYFSTVLEIILHAYSFMVGGLFIPTLAAYFSKRPDNKAALLSMLSGGTVTVALIFLNPELPFDLDPSVWGIALSSAVYLSVNIIRTKNE
ncbi:MAG: sodium:solute symporter family protein [Melioribacteraceae bacterium]|nr:sodium:solute symporter family protein [Melioribacteraceae bacterium]